MLLLLLSTFSAGLGTLDPQPQAPRHVILILADDLGYADLACYGSRYYRTPHIDRLAAEGTRFTDAYSAGPNCAPTRASLMSGMYPPRHGVYTVDSGARGKAENRKLIPAPNRKDLDLGFETLPEALGANGFVTAHLGKWHLGKVGKSGPKEHGFDINVGGNHTGSPRGGYFAPYKNPQLIAKEPKESLTERIGIEASRILTKQVTAGERVFLNLAFYAVHTPIQARKSDLERWSDVPGSDGQENPKYAAMIEAMDRSIGGVMLTLDQLGIRDETLVIFTSDNGGLGGYERAGVIGAKDITRNGDLRGGKGMLYEGGIRVPFIARGPGIESGRVERTPVSSIDLFPTFIEASGAKRSARYSLDGESIWPLLTQGNPLDREALHWHFPGYLQASGAKGTWRTRPGAALRSGPWKLIHFFEDDRVELYHLGDDIGETTDLAAQESDVRDQLLHRMKEWRRRTAAPMPTHPD